MRTNIALLSAQKNEGPFLLEFVAHHIAIGFSRIFIVTNPSDDGTSELADALCQAGYIDHLYLQTPPGQSPQDHAFSVAREHFSLDKFEWLMVLDADELLNIHVSSGSISDFISSLPEATDVISINTACFGDFPHRFWNLKSSSFSFFYRLQSAHWRNSVSKSIIHFPHNFRTLRPHGPTGFLPRRRVQIAFHGGLQHLSANFDDPTIYRSLRRPGSFDEVHKLAQVNHYLIRTWDAFQLRAERGRGAIPHSSKNDRHTPEYFRNFSRARFFDNSILKYSEEFYGVVDELLRNQDVRTCHEFSVRRYIDKIAKLGLVL
jgi:hypothetical protein